MVRAPPEKSALLRPPPPRSGLWMIAAGNSRFRRNGEML
jgi:hypothetical protein